MSGHALPVLVAAVAGGVVGLWCARWLRSQAYRYDGELDRPTRRAGWVVPVCVALPVLLVLARPHEPVLVTVQAMAGAVLVVLAAIDIDVWRLPDMLTVPLVVGLALGLLVVALLEDDTLAWVRALLAGGVLGLVYLVMTAVGRSSGMGLGDAKLAPSLGMLLGFQSWSHVLLGSLATFLIAGVAAGYLMIVTDAGRKSHFAFGPHLVAGTLLVLVAPAIGAVV